MRNYEITSKNLTNNIIDMMAKYGFNGISIRKITSKTGIKESTFYYYFKNKKSIFEKIFKTYEEILNKKLVMKENLNGYLFLQNSIIKILKMFNDSNIVKLWRIMNIEQYNADILIKSKIISIKKIYKNYLKDIILFLVNNKNINSEDTEMIIDDLYNNITFLLNEYVELKLQEKNTNFIEEKIYKFIKYFWNKII